MDRSNILNEVYEWLRYKKLVSSKKDFAERIGIDKTNLSSAFNGMEKYLTDNLFIKISEAFPLLNSDWLLTGKGNMLKEESVSTNSENTNQQSDDMTIQKLLEALERKDKQINALLEQNSNLTTIISRFSGVSPLDDRIFPPPYDQRKYARFRALDGSIDWMSYCINGKIES